MQDIDLTTLTTGVALLTGVRYALFAGLAWLLGYVFFRRRWFHRKIVQRLPASADVRREIWYSLRTVLIFGVVGAVTIWAARRGWTQMYWNFGDHSTGWWWASVGLTILLHDTWFYWTHRLMHHRKLFRLVHLDHHRSTNPTPWAAFAFSPGEAVAQAAIFPLTISLMPIHPLAFGLFMVWQMFFNVIGHTGYEYNRRGFMNSWARFIINTPTNHAMHHESMHANYGLYFNFWDRLLRTNHANYESRFREVTSRIPSKTVETTLPTTHSGQPCPGEG